MKLKNQCRKFLNFKLMVEFLEFKEVGYSIGVTVRNTSSFPEYRKDLTHNLNAVKISTSAIG